MKYKYTPQRWAYLFFCLLFLFSYHSFSQVGIGTTNPESTLDVRAVNHNGPVTPNDGILAPRINSLATAGSQDGQLVYLIEDSGSFKRGFYHWNGSLWKTFSQNSSSVEVKTLVDPDVVIAGPPTSAAVFPYNISTPIPDNNTIVIPMSVGGVSGVISDVTIQFNITHAYLGDIEIRLESPTGEVLLLTADNGNPGNNYIDTNFTDAGTINITAGLDPFTGDYMPQGGVCGPELVSTFSGFKGLTPNGTWNIIVTDDDINSIGTVNSFTLRVSGTLAAEWLLLGEIAVNYFDDSAIIVQTTYSGDPLNLTGVKTAITRTNTSVPANTTVTALPGTDLNYASASPSGTGNVWVNTFNQARDVGLTNNTTYYYQLWRQGNIEEPLEDNETFSIVPLRIQQ